MEIAVSTIFDRLKDDSPAYFRQFCMDKIECVTGELTDKNFGLSRKISRCSPAGLISLSI